ncbi:hypothetical protein [Halobaculum sp. MBLA0143]|uniref:hypothetical protein n=1 Tax=Halobaculum sp. MBLA0143 TaxID=3079933 RepID=UPI003525597D
MNRHRLRGILVQGLVAPAGTLAVVAAVAVAVGAEPGLAVLLVSTVAAAGTAGLLLSQTRSMEPDDDDGPPTGRDGRTAVGLRSELTDDAELDDVGRETVVTRYATGLFVQSVAVVLYLGKLFG